MQSVCASELLEYSGIYIYIFDQDRCGVSSFAAKFFSYKYTVSIATAVISTICLF